MTLDSWSNILYNLMDTFDNGFLPALFCLTIIFLGSFFLLNLMLAVIMESYISGGTKYNEIAEQNLLQEQQQLEHRI